MFVWLSCYTYDFDYLVLLDLLGVIYLGIEVVVRMVMDCKLVWVMVGNIGRNTGQKWGPKTGKNGPGVWAFCKIDFSAMLKPV